MKKKNIVDVVKSKHGNVNHHIVNSIVSDVFEAMSKALQNKEHITIYNFGEFYFKRSNVKNVHDFKTKQHIPFAGRYNIKFRASPCIEKEAKKWMDEGQGAPASE